MIKEERRRKKRRKRILIVLIIVGAIVAAGAFFVLEVCTVRDVEVEGNVLYDDETIKNTVLNDKFSTNTLYVFFKNNCPGCGPLYDDLRICDIESGDVLFNVCPSKKAVYWHGNWDGEVFESMKDLKNWFRRFEAA